MSIIDNVKEVVTLVQKLDDIELYRKIVELEGDIIELTRVNRELEENISKLLKGNEVISKLKFDSPFYSNEDGSELYCAKCIESEQLPIHLAKTTDLKMGRRIWMCPQCKTEYADTRDQ